MTTTVVDFGSLPFASSLTRGSFCCRILEALVRHCAPVDRAGKYQHDDVVVAAVAGAGCGGGGGACGRGGGA